MVDRQKVCIRCRASKSVRDFSRSNRLADGSTLLRRVCKQCRRRGNGPDRCPRVPVEPFAAWLAFVLRRDGMTSAETAEMLGVPERTIRRILGHEMRRVEVDLVDRALIRDGTIELDDLYPNLWEAA